MVVAAETVAVVGAVDVVAAAAASVARAQHVGQR